MYIYQYVKDRAYIKKDQNITFDCQTLCSTDTRTATNYPPRASQTKQ